MTTKTEKRIAWAVLIAILATMGVLSNVRADTKISALPAAAAATGVDPIPTVQAGATVKQTVSGIDTYVKANGATLAVGVGGTGLSGVAGDDATLIGNGTIWESKALTSCSSATSAVTYNTSTNAWGCNILTGTVSSVSLSAPALFTIGGSPVTTTGTLSLSYSGTALPVANGGTNLTAAADDNLMMGNGTTWQTKAVPLCGDSTHALGYDTSTNTWSCTNVTGGGGTPGGSDTQVQFNNAGAFGGDADFLWVLSTNVLTLGSSGTPASILGGASAGLTIRGGAAATSAGGATTISSGAGTSSGQAGLITIQPGAAGGGGGVAGQNVTIQAGTGGTTSGNGGALNLNGGNGVSTNGNAGGIAITGGTGVGSGSGGSIALSGGVAGSTGGGGPIDITASNAGASSGGAGGNVTLTAGNGNGTNQNGGSMTISAGVPTGSGTGALTLKTNNAARIVINANGSWATPAATTAGTVLMTVSSSAAPTFQSLNSASTGNSSIKAQRVTTGSLTAGVSTNVTLTWGAAFGDTSYTATCSVQDSTAATASLSVVHIETLAAGSLVVRVNNASAGSLTGTLHCIGVHD